LRRKYLLALLLLILAFNYVDRLALGLLLEDIKTDLALSDTQLGFLSGMAFAVFYSVMGIPIARWADRGDRVMIISVTTAIWSAAVALCASAGSFLQMLWIRVAVAVGEAGCVPPAHSLIADTFTREERPRAVALYMLGAPLSFLIGYFLAGWINELVGWRLTFVFLGLPGLALALLIRFTLVDPRESRTPTAAVRPGMREVLWTLWGIATFRHMLYCYSVSYFFGYGILQWQPTFFVRSHGMETGELGTWFALVNGIGALLGTYIGGEWAARRAANDESAQLRAIAVAYCTFGAFSALVYVAGNPYLAFLFMGLAAFGGAAANGPFFATLQILVPAHMRATAIAVLFLFANLIGMGLGPLAAGVLSDVLRPSLGAESLRYALLALCPGYAWVGWHLWKASRTVNFDMR
jgi:predicted MFS family arabinose efflux permease